MVVIKESVHCLYFKLHANTHQLSLYLQGTLYKNANAVLVSEGQAALGVGVMLISVAYASTQSHGDI